MHIDIIQQAWEVAERLHRRQIYGAEDVPYLYHIGKVLVEAINATINFDDKRRTTILLSSILHDTLEDSVMTEYYLADKFGIDVFKIVKALSKDDSLSKKDQMIDSLQRIKLIGENAAIVKLCDRISNLSQAPPDTWEPEWIISYSEESELILKELGGFNEKLARRLNSILVGYKEKYYIG